MADFKDHFSGHAAAYAEARPGYPETLFSQLATLAPAHDQAWDCGTGNGQAAVALAAHFARVIATDASAEQIGSAFPNARVTYRVAPAEHAGLPDHSVDLVTVAQAAHWFDLPAFYAEVRRVAKPGAVIALWCYGVCHITPDVDAVVATFYEGEIGPYWPPERRLIDEAYRSLPFPFAKLDMPPISMSLDWTLPQLLAYLASWSAVQRCIRATGRDPIPALTEALAAAWGKPDSARRVEWPLALRTGRVDG
ncbi:MAG TPA: class I SAM-dependent methyltransferase [Gammaproteobacteria bacterium]|nr:class I SAM-dependent methyltransferase [Gammaproteobacteria bacterium]